MSAAAGPSTDALALSASLFASSIDAWIPAGFGVSKPEAERAREFEAALTAARNDRLGLGHPDTASVAAGRNGRGRGDAGLASLERFEAQRKRKGKARAADENGDRVGTGSDGADGSEEEESRAKMVKKRRKDPFGGGKDVFGGGKAKIKVPRVVLALEPVVEPPDTGDISREAVEPSSTTAEPPSIESASSRSGEAGIADQHKPGTTDAPAELDDDSTRAASAPGASTLAVAADGTVKSKSQLRREKRKAAKSRKAEAAP